MAVDEVVIIPYRDGPYLVRGPARLCTQDGTIIDGGRSTLALCRCGKSRLRPFCDGSHQLIHFRAPSGQEATIASQAPHSSVPPTPRKTSDHGRRRNGAVDPGQQLHATCSQLASVGQSLSRLLALQPPPARRQALSEAATLVAAAAALLETAVSDLPASGSGGELG